MKNPDLVKKILPRFKIDYRHEIYAEGSSSEKSDVENFELPENQLPVLMPAFEDVMLAFGVDHGDHYTLLQKEFLVTNTETTVEALREIAVQNMLGICGNNIEMHGDPAEVAMLTCGGNYEATLMLATTIWENLKDHFPAGILAAIPATDLLFLAANNENGRQKLKETVINCFKNSEIEGILSKAIYLREHGDWKMLEAAFLTA